MKQQKHGRSARNGRSPSPYTKYKKTPYRYSEKLRRWEVAIKEGRRGLADRLAAEMNLERRGTLREPESAA